MAVPTDVARGFAPDPTVRYKLIYLAQRHPHLPADAFPAAWRAHSRLAASFGPDLARHFVTVHQCVRDRDDPLPDSFAGPHDGSSILTMCSWADLMAARYHPHALNELATDEARVFAGPVEAWTMAVAEHVLTDGASTGHVLLSFMAAKGATGAADVVGRARDWLGERQSAIGARRLVLDSVVDPAASLPFVAVVEAWFDTRPAALAAARDHAIIAALEMADLFDPARGVRLFARLNSTRIDR